MKSAYEVAEVSSTVCQRTGKKHRPTVNQVIGRQLLILTVDPAVAHEPVLISWLQSVCETVLGNHSWMREPFWKAKLSEKSFQHTTGAKK